MVSRHGKRRIVKDAPSRPLSPPPFPFPVMRTAMAMAPVGVGEQTVQAATMQFSIRSSVL